MKRLSDKIKSFREEDPLWIKGDIKNKVKLKYEQYLRYLIHQRESEYFAARENLRNEINNLTSKYKKEMSSKYQQRTE